MSPSPTVAYLGLSCAALCWASAFIAGKLALVELTPLTLAAWRYVFAVAMLLPFVLRRSAWRGIGDHPGRLAVMVLCGGVLYPSLFLGALSRTTATNTSLLIALNPTLTALLAPLAGERIDPRRLPGILLALLGAALVITKGDLGRIGEIGHASGDVLAVVAASCWVGFNVASRRVVGRARPAAINSVVTASGRSPCSLSRARRSPCASSRRRLRRRSSASSSWPPSRPRSRGSSSSSACARSG
jgi:drug/metabolite transporter (DMT)-like permease